MKSFLSSKPGWIAFVSGLLLSSTFAPYHFNWLVWVSLVPLYLCVMKRKDAGVFYLGYIFGMAHFSSTLFWLREIQFLCPFGVSIIISFFPALWIWILRKLYWNLIFPYPAEPTADASSEKFLPMKWQQFVLIFSGAFIWCFFEWVRSWIFTGFPWNILAVSQAYNTSLLPLASITGAYGISFLIVVVNMSIAVAVEEYLLKKKIKDKPYGPMWPYAISIFFVIAIFIVAHAAKPIRDNAKEIKVAQIQGYIEPELKRPITWNESMVALNYYLDSSYAASKQDPDLIIWPETALPLAFRTITRAYRMKVEYLANTIGIPMLIGSVDYIPPDRENEMPFEKRPRYNAAFFINKEGKLEDHYYKIHTVPFGEYMPFQYLIPTPIYDFMVKAAGMGPSLSEGTDFTVFNINDNVYMGVNICFEDVFPEISRGFVLNGANLLAVITNDAWFNKTSGSEQHTAHSILRAVELATPIVRCGNHAESCIITFDGELQSLLVNPRNNHRFYKGWQVVSVKVPSPGQLTFYTRYPYAFMGPVIFISALIIVFVLLKFYERKTKLLEKISSEPPKPNQEAEEV